MQRKRAAMPLLVSFAMPRRVKILFILNALLQVADLHSSLISPASETNRLILLLASHVGFNFSIVVTKSICLYVIYLLRRHWKTTAGVFDGEFLIALTLVALLMSGVVLNNYCSIAR